MKIINESYYFTSFMLNLLIENWEAKFRFIKFLNLFVFSFSLYHKYTFKAKVIEKQAISELNNLRIQKNIQQKEAQISENCFCYYL